MSGVLLPASWAAHNRRLDCRLSRLSAARSIPMKPATPQEIEQTLRDMPEMQKRKLAEVLFRFAMRIGLIDESGNPVKKRESIEANHRDIAIRV